MVDIHSEEYILGQNIRKYRLRLGWSQADLSNAVDIDRADISKYENGAKGIMSSRHQEIVKETIDAFLFQESHVAMAG